MEMASIIVIVRENRLNWLSWDWEAVRLVKKYMWKEREEKDFRKRNNWIWKGLALMKRTQEIKLSGSRRLEWPTSNVVERKNKII